MKKKFGENFSVETFLVEIFLLQNHFLASFLEEKNWSGFFGRDFFVAKSFPRKQFG
jgi:hypothetical protein